VLSGGTGGSGDTAFSGGVGSGGSADSSTCAQESVFTAFLAVVVAVGLAVCANNIEILS
jgi:hypothetical protein